LVFDTGLSADGSVSCATCHPAEGHFTDGRRRGRGLDDLPRHTPALWNMAYNRWFFWDGRADALWNQVLHPLEDPREHGISRVGVVRHVADDPELAAAYEALFGRLPDLTGLPDQARPSPGDLRHPHREAWLALDDARRETLHRAIADDGGTGIGVGCAGEHQNSRAHFGEVSRPAGFINRTADGVGVVHRQHPVARQGHGA
jgi:cytochrome c peroxidase